MHAIDRAAARRWPSVPRLLAGPPLGRPESLAEHSARLGPQPPAADARAMPALLDAAGLLGRGGSAFPVGQKWRGVAERSSGGAVVVVNGAEGEPGSAKDRALMTNRPHLVLDGAVLAAQAIGADEVVVYVGGEHRAAISALRRALDERFDQVPVSLVAAPPGYVSGEQSAAVHFVNSGEALPTSPPRPYVRGVRGQPTLVQNVESLAHAALIGRFGDEWYRAAGRGATRGTALVTVTGAARQPGVREIEIGTPLDELLASAGVERSVAQAVLLGGYFGTWARLDDTAGLTLDPIALRARSLAFGAGVVTILPASECGVDATAQIMAYMAGESAAQCGPCAFGLRALADATGRIAARRASGDDIARVRRWADQVRGRGACAHPDGAIGLLTSALEAFEDEFAVHARLGGCSVGRPVAEVA